MVELKDCYYYNYKRLKLKCAARECRARFAIIDAVNVCFRRWSHLVYYTQQNICIVV